LGVDGGARFGAPGDAGGARFGAARRGDGRDGAALLGAALLGFVGGDFFGAARGGGRLGAPRFGFRPGTWGAGLLGGRRDGFLRPPATIGGGGTPSFFCKNFSLQEQTRRHSVLS